MYPPASLAFDVEDDNSHCAPKIKLRVTGGLVDCLRALDAKATASLEKHMQDHLYKACLQEGLWLPARGEAYGIYDAEGKKTRGSLADLKRGVTVTVKASGFGIVLHRNNGGSSKVCVNAQKVLELAEGA